MDKLQQKFWNSNIRHIIFDLDGTLYSSKSGIEFQIPKSMVKQTSIELSIDEESARVLLRKYRDEFKSSVLGLQKYHNIDPNIFYLKVYNRLDISPIEKYENFENLISDLSIKCDLYLLTNSNITHAIKVLKALDLFGYFSKIYSVEFSNFIRKPNIEVYQNVIKDLSVDTDKILNIDDSYLNLKIANQLGIKTALVSNGISEPPLFWEMHKKLFHKPPSFLDASEHNINKLIEKLLQTI
jgi:putative hydrolase of the HAD superfamily